VKLVARRTRDVGLALGRRWRRYVNGEPEVRYHCNLCGAACRSAPRELGREIRSCAWCGSTLRWRALVAALSTELFGEVLTIPQFPRRADLKGLGLSDDRCYATGLTRKLAYVNTFYDREPRFDIMRVGAEHLDRYDFLIASDVFEHVPPPPLVAFENARRMLRPGGRLVFSVPYRVDGETTEHFPELFDYELSHEGAGRVLKNRTSDGRIQEFRNLAFHGGRGFTLEMRVFSLPGIRDCVARAGFSRLMVYDQDDPAFGICWQGRAGSHVIVARA
jgi:SAM-dependent methyltransferase